MFAKAWEDFKKDLVNGEVETDVIKRVMKVIPFNETSLYRADAVWDFVSKDIYSSKALEVNDDFYQGGSTEFGDILEDLQVEVRENGPDTFCLVRDETTGNYYLFDSQDFIKVVR